MRAHRWLQTQASHARTDSDDLLSSDWPIRVSQGTFDSKTTQVQPRSSSRLASALCNYLIRSTAVDDSTIDSRARNESLGLTSAHDLAISVIGRKPALTHIRECPSILLDACCEGIILLDCFLFPHPPGLLISLLATFRSPIAMSPSAIDPQAIADTQAAAFIDRLSVNGVETRRSKAPRIGGGIAAHASSDMFKSLVWTTSSRKMDRHRLVIDSISGLWQA